MARYTKIGRFKVADPIPRPRRRYRPQRRRYWMSYRLLRDFAIAAGLGFGMLVFDGYEKAGGMSWLRQADAWMTAWQHPEPKRSPTVVRTAAASSNVGSIPMCSGRVRVTCIVDGDTGWHDGTKWRLVAQSGGVDAPEISKPECAAERTAGDRATRRLQLLMSSGYTLSGGDYDRYDRRLVQVTLADGRDAGDVLLDEGLAQPWPNRGNPWC